MPELRNVLIFSFYVVDKSNKVNTCWPAIKNVKSSSFFFSYDQFPLKKVSMLSYEFKYECCLCLIAFLNSISK